MFTFQTSNRNHYFLVDPTCEKCPEGVCDRTSDGKCAIYNDGYHCLLGAAGVQCNYPGKCFDYGGDGEIDFNEFIRVIVGPLNNTRA